MRLLLLALIIPNIVSGCFCCPRRAEATIAEEAGFPSPAEEPSQRTALADRSELAVVARRPEAGIPYQRLPVRLPSPAEELPRTVLTARLEQLSLASRRSEAEIEEVVMFPSRAYELSQRPSLAARPEEVSVASNEGRLRTNATFRSYVQENVSISPEHENTPCYIIDGYCASWSHGTWYASGHILATLFFKQGKTTLGNLDIGQTAVVDYGEGRCIVQITNPREAKLICSPSKFKSDLDRITFKRERCDAALTKNGKTIVLVLDNVLEFIRLTRTEAWITHCWFSDIRFINRQPNVPHNGTGLTWDYLDEFYDRGKHNVCLVFNSHCWDVLVRDEDGRMFEFVGSDGITIDGIESPIRGINQKAAKFELLHNAQQTQPLVLALEYGAGVGLYQNTLINVIKFSPSGRVLPLGNGPNLIATSESEMTLYDGHEGELIRDFILQR